MGTWGDRADDLLDLVPARVTNTSHQLHPDLADAPIRRLNEPYPVDGCSGHGQLENQTQTIFQCRSPRFEGAEYFRVTRDDYDAL